MSELEKSLRKRLATLEKKVKKNKINFEAKRKLRQEEDDDSESDSDNEDGVVKKKARMSESSDSDQDRIIVPKRKKELSKKKPAKKRSLADVEEDSTDSETDDEEDVVKYKKKRTGRDLLDLDSDEEERVIDQENRDLSAQLKREQLIKYEEEAEQIRSILEMLTIKQEEILDIDGKKEIKSYTNSELEYVSTVVIDMDNILSSVSKSLSQKERDGRAYEITERAILHFFGTQKQDIKLSVKSTSVYLQIITAMCIRYYGTKSSVENSYKEGLEFLENGPQAEFGDKTSLFKKLYVACLSNPRAIRKRVFSLEVSEKNAEKLYSLALKGLLPFARGIHEWVIVEPNINRIERDQRILEVLNTTKNVALKVSGTLRVNPKENESRGGLGFGRDDRFIDQLVMWHESRVFGEEKNKSSINASIEFTSESNNPHTYLRFPWVSVTAPVVISMKRKDQEITIKDLSRPFATYLIGKGENATLNITLKNGVSDRQAVRELERQFGKNISKLKMKFTNII